MVLLTGASGFIGKHLLKSLQQKFGFDKVVAMTSKPIEDGRFVLHENYNFSPDFVLDNGLQEIEIIVHAGAFIPKSGADANNWKSCNANINSTNQLYALDFQHLKKIIFLSTVDVYACTSEKISEDTTVRPQTLYAESKLYCEKMTRAFAEQNHQICQILRIGHTYGPGEEAYQKVIPNTMKRLMKNLSPQIWGSGDELRAFIYIDDVVAAILKSISYDNFLGEINVVSENAVTISALVEKIIEISGSTQNIEFINKENKGNSLSFDNYKLKDLLLTEEISLDIGIKKEFEYLKKLA